MQRGIASRGPRCAAALVLALASIAFVADARADPIMDSTGQEVDSELDARLTAARALRVGDRVAEDLDKSIALLEQITREKPDYFRAWYNLALAYLQKDPENFEPIQKAFQIAADIQAGNPSIKDGSLYNSYGWALLNARLYSEAEQNLKRGLELADSNGDWTNSALNYNLGRLYFEQGDIPHAEEFLNVAIEKYNNGMAVELKAIMEKTK